ncbi:MAG: DUF2088 domain-containing protein [Verrucomicrobia bacterium]|nr:DUF2088 domain-containing protein [Verrucomicrobiota bacterium]
MTTNFPRMLSIRQSFPATPSLNLEAVLETEFTKIRSQIKPGKKIAVAVGSRGITNLDQIVAGLVRLLKNAGAEVFIVPAMGSHAGATPEGQTEILAGYGVSEAALGVPVRATMDVRVLGKTGDGLELQFSAEALRADGIIVVNRIKPHTDFAGSIGSGLLKMIVVGLGKRVGAAAYHVESSRLGYERVLRTIAHESLRLAPILGGVGIVENQRHETARIEFLSRDEIERGEERLFLEAKRLMPKLPFDDIDLLIVDRIGKNISGSGMDPNIIGRGVHGYLSSLGNQHNLTPFIRRLFVRGLTPETHGNAIGIGLADLTTTRLVHEMDKSVTYINSLTSLTPNCAKIPIHFDTDREALTQALRSLGLADSRAARVIRIADTLSLERMQISEAYGESVKQISSLTRTTEPREMVFDSEGNLPPLET